jgi:manganese/zinc/iron transport system permease protein
MLLQLESILIAIVTAAACALPGVFLMLRRSAMVSDAIGHTVLLGIVIAYLVVRDADSIWLSIGAVAAGLVTVWLIELQRDSGLMREDSAIGLVFPLLFSLAVLLISRYTADLHLDTDSVLLGELAFAPFDRLTLFGLNLPRALWIGSGVLLLNLVLWLLFAKELALSTFDAALAQTLGFAPLVIHYGLMASVSLTAVSAFDAVGAVLVVALMIGPPAAARLLVDRLPPLIALSLLFAVLSAVLGYAAALLLNTTIAGAIAVTTALLTAAAFAVQQLRRRSAVAAA